VGHLRAKRPMMNPTAMALPNVTNGRALMVAHAVLASLTLFSCIRAGT